MVRFAVLGGTGFTGRLVLQALARRGHTVLLAGRDPARSRAAVPEDLEVEAVHELDLRHDDDALRSFLADTGPDVLVNTVGPFTELGDRVVAAAVAAGVPYVDCAGEQPFLRELHDRWDGAAAGAGVPVAPGMGFEFLLGDLLGTLAADAAPGRTEIHVAYVLPRMSDLVRGWSLGTRRSIAAALGAPAVVHRDGQLVEEQPGEIRRLAWFPRPVGPHHAAAIPGGEALSLPSHLPGLRLVRTYLAVPSMVAELMQAMATWSQRPGVARWVSRILTAGDDPSEERRQGTRWACVAEAQGLEGTVRAWAYGQDLYALTAAALVLVGERLVEEPPGGGVLAAAQVHDPAELLDELAARTGLRWSVARP